MGCKREMSWRALFLFCVLSLVVVSPGCKLFTWDTTTPSQREAVKDRLRALLATIGYDFQEGVLKYVNVEDAPELTNFTGPNANGSYLCMSPPHREGEYLGLDYAGRSQMWGEAVERLYSPFRLDAGEGVICVMRMPPAARYCGVQPYLCGRWSDALNRDLPPALVLQEGLNNLSMNSAGPPGDPFNEMVVFFLTADRELEEEVRSVLAAGGLSPSWWNVLWIPITVPLGLNQEAAPLAAIFRVSSPESQEELDRYVQGIPYGGIPAVLGRITPKPQWPNRSPVVRYGLPTFTDPKSVDSEHWLQSHMDKLVERIKRYHRAQGYRVKEIPTIQMNIPGLKRTESFAFMVGLPSMDACYGTSAQVSIDEYPGSFYVALAVNHHVTGLAAYSSIGPYARPTLMGAAGVTDRDMPGPTTEWYLDELGTTGEERDTVLRYFGVFRFARPGVLSDHVVDLPLTCDPVPWDPRQTAMPAFPLGEPVIFTTRMYLHPLTKTAPPADQMVKLVLLQVWRD